MAKPPTVRKVNGKWTLTRPGYGFSPNPVVEQYRTFQAAHRARTDGRPSTDGGHTEPDYLPMHRDRYRYR